MRKIALLLSIMIMAALPAAAQVEIAWERLDGGFSATQTVDIDSLSNVYVNRLGSFLGVPGAWTLSFDSNGQSRWQRFYADISGGCGDPLLSTISPAGDFYFAGCGQVDGQRNILTVRYTTGGDSIWTRSYRGPVENTATISGIATDPSGNLYVAGTSDGPCWAILKYSRMGDLLWTRLFTGHPNYYIGGIYGTSLDSDGNLVVVGAMVTRQNPRSSGFSSIKFDSNGNELWIAWLESVTVLSAAYMAIDRENNILISALDNRIAYFRQPMIIKILPNGDAAWYRTYTDGSYFEGYLYSIAADSAGNIYITGPILSGENYDHDFKTIKYSPGGDLLWARTHAEIDSSYEFPLSIAIGQGGEVYVAGECRRESGYKVKIVKYAADGALIWVTYYSRGGLSTSFTGFVLDRSDNIYLTTAAGGCTVTAKLVQTPTGMVDPSLPGENSLSQNYPNPFNASTIISYCLPQAGDVTIDIFDITGRKIETLLSGYSQAGEHSMVWNAEGVTSGVYFYRIKAGGYQKNKRCVLLK